MRVGDVGKGTAASVASRLTPGAIRGHSTPAVGRPNRPLNSSEVAVRYWFPAFVSRTRRFTARRPLAVTALAVVALGAGLWRDAATPAAQSTSRGRRIEVLFLDSHRGYSETRPASRTLRASLHVSNVPDVTRGGMYRDYAHAVNCDTS